MTVVVSGREMQGGLSRRRRNVRRETTGTRGVWHEGGRAGGGGNVREGEDWAHLCECATIGWLWCSVGLWLGVGVGGGKSTEVFVAGWPGRGRAQRDR